MDKTIGILSLGCARNLVDSESILSGLKGKGFSIVDLEEAGGSFFEGKDRINAVLVNTCAFIKEAKEESIGTILDLIELKKQGRLKRIIVAGCLAQRYKEDLLKHFPEVDAFLGTIALNHTVRDFRLTPAHYAYVKICEGCINNCSFCVIPKIKPHFSSRRPESIISEIKTLKRQGCNEVNLIGQDISAYGLDWSGQSQLSGLIRQISEEIRQISWLRLLYLSPERLSDELIEVIATCAGVVKYIDLPLQHINERILKLMRRKVNSLGIFRLIGKIRKRIPEAAIRTTLIVGFPTETDKEFNELLDFVKEVKFERLGAFMYSREEGSIAYGLKKQIPEKVKQERYHALMSCQEGISAGVNQKWLGKTLRVLIEEKQQAHLYIGRSQFDAPEVDGLVYVKSEKELPLGSFSDVKICDTLEYDLAGEAQ